MKSLLLSFLALLAISTTLFSQEKIRKIQFNLSKNNVAIAGYDPVAYFVSNKAIKGSESIKVYAEGVVYYFSSPANKNLFLNNYEKYEPQYGGWCAYAMGATNDKVEIDPETFKIVNGKLYLFYHSWVNNTLTKWNKDEVSLKAKADNSWNIFFR